MKKILLLLLFLTLSVHGGLELHTVTVKSLRKLSDTHYFFVFIPTSDNQSSLAKGHEYKVIIRHNPRGFTDGIQNSKKWNVAQFNNALKLMQSQITQSKRFAFVGFPGFRALKSRNYKSYLVTETLTLHRGIKGSDKEFVRFIDSDLASFAKPDKVVEQVAASDR